MKSLYAKITAFLLMAGLLSACGARAAATSPSTTQAATGPTTDAQLLAQTSGVSFTKDILPILQSRCVNCHGGERVSNGLSMKTYTDLMSGSQNGPVVTPGNAADSTMIQMIAEQKMPKNGPKLTPSQVQTITDWVNQGALNN